MKALELTGQRFGRLIVESKNSIRALSGNIRWDCVCDCGNRTTVVGYSLVRGDTTSCGCYAIETTKERETVHGMTSTAEYRSWKAMIRRCTNSNDKSYSDYGGRGITVCDRWMNSFEAFYQDMGNRPSVDHSLDREENDKGYYKENCRWATRIEQNNNKRNNTLHNYNGQEYSIKQLAELPEAKINGICANTLKNRINQYKYSINEAISTPVMVKVRHIR